MDTVTSQPQYSLEELRKKPFSQLTEEEAAWAVEHNKEIFDKHFDPEYVRQLNTEIVDLVGTYFRPEFVGFDEMPAREKGDRPLIYACNHSGMAFPWDAMIFGMGLFYQHDFELKRLFRALAAPALSASNLMNPFMIPHFWKRVGAIDATGLNFETMMQYEDSHLLVYPEGVPGIGKGFNRRYELQTFSTSMIRMAIKYQTDIIGVSCVNGEYINPYSYSSKALNKLVNMLGIPYLPVALHTPLLLILPWMFYYGLPAKLTYIRGNRYSPFEMAGRKPIEEVSEEMIRAIRDEIQADMQVELTQGVEEHGQKPFDWKEFRQKLVKNWRDLPYWTPIGWPALFTEFERRYQKEEAPPRGVIRGWFKFWRIIFRNPILIGYYIPLLGWIPILIKGLYGREKVRDWKGPK
ncbi:MAG: 1-acyl-sn-glycerol-3-phosphate acyltransferase [Bacteroidota bacterium]